MRHRISVGCTVVPFLLAAVCGWSADLPTAVDSPAAPIPKIAEDDDPEVLLETSFEGVFPRLPWRVSRATDAAEVDWGRTRYRASEGNYSIYCAGMGPEAPGDGGPAPANMASWTIVGPYDLSETTAGTLTFKLWLSTERYQDVLMWLVSTDGENFSGSARSTSTNGWQTVTTDLKNWGAAGDVIGESEVWIAWVYQSDHSNLFEGAYIDEVTLTVDVGDPGEEGAAYTSNADFALGTMVGLESTSDMLELSDGWDTLPFLWVPNSVTGTVSKIDAESGGELGRYRVGPDGNANPAVAAVDFEGSCWVGNRNAGTVVKIGLFENGGCVDRDGSGDIDTSTDSDGDGNVSGSEILAWGEDECVLIETSLAEGSEGPHVPGDDHDDYEINNLQALAVDAAGDVWAGVYETSRLYRLDGDTGDVLEQIDVSDESTRPTAAVIDGSGTLWVSSWPDQWVLEVEPTTLAKNRVTLEHISRGLAVDKDDDILVSASEQQLISKIDTELEEVEWTRTAGYLANGIATSENGRIWLAAPGDSTLSRYSAQGLDVRFVTITGGMTGVAVDQAGKVWVLGDLTDTVYRVDPDAVIVDLQKPIVGTVSHNATGDMTGVVVRNVTSRFGTWTVVHDSQVAGTPWGVLTWEAQQPTGTSVAVRVRSSEDAETWSPWERAVSGQELSDTPAGRQIEIQVSLQQVSGTQFPSLEELTVTPATIVVAPEASYTWSPGSPAAGQTIQFTDTSSGDPTSWSWDFDDGTNSDQQNPTHVFTNPGDYNVGLTAVNDAGSDTASFSLTIGPASSCSLSCSAVVPATAELNSPVSFEADSVVSGCAGDVDYSWDFGDGNSSSAQNPTIAYASTGTLRWGVTATIESVSCTRSGDITVSGAGPTSCSSTYWVPVVSRDNGLNGSVWRSDLGLLGVDPAGASVELRLHTGGVTTTRVVTVSPTAMVDLVDVVGWLDSDFEGSGALEICADGELAVNSRTYNTLAFGSDCFPDGTFGQHLSGDPGDTGLTSGEVAWLGQLRESADFRTNIGLVNTGAETATVEISLFDATGAELLMYQVTIESGTWRQENRPFSRLAGRDDLDAASAKVTLVSGGPVVAYASVIDGQTNDATTIPMRR